MKQLFLICVIILLLYSYHIAPSGIDLVSFLNASHRITYVFLGSVVSGGFVLTDILKWVYRKAICALTRKKRSYTETIQAAHPVRFYSLNDDKDTKG